MAWLLVSFKEHHRSSSAHPLCCGGEGASASAAARCLRTPYEWQKIDSKTKQPFAIALKTGEPYAFAGLWEIRRDTNAGTALRSFAIVTADPSEVVQPLHNRMPVIVQERDYDRWLSTESARPPLDLLRRYDAGLMTAWKVNTAVGNVKSDSPVLIEPASTTPTPIDDGADESPGPLFS